MNEFVGFGTLLRFILKKDRRSLAIWVFVLALLPIVTANAFFELTPTEADRQAMAATAIANPAFQALLGPVYGTSVGALTAWRAGTLGAVLVALMAVLTVIKHTREEEEAGRAELIGSAVVGRHALAAAAVTLVALAGLVIGVVIVVGLIGLGLPAAGSLAFGVGYLMVALTFGAIGVLGAQLPEGAGAARGIGVGVLGVAFMLRAVGDATDLESLAWLSPIGWFSRLRPFADERWWVLALYAGLSLMTVLVAFALASARDVGAGVFPPRRGPARAAPYLRTATALAYRLHRAGWLGWTVGLAALALVYGSIADSIGDLLADNPQLAEFFDMLGGEQGIVDAFFGVTMAILALIASAYAIRTAFRLRMEEGERRADPVLATPTPRWRWMGSHLLFAIGGSAVMLLISATVAGATYGAMIGDVGGQIGGVVEAAMLQIPAVWVMAGLAAALYGSAPRLTQVAWGALVAFLLFAQLGAILQLPQWVLNLSPFTHVPAYPVQALDPTPIVMLLAVAVALLAVGFSGFRRRDLA